MSCADADAAGAEVAVPDASKKRKRSPGFKQQPHVVKALVAGGYAGHLLELIGDGKKDVRAQWWRDNRVDVFDLIDEKREKVMEVHHVEEADLELLDAEERRRVKAQRFGNSLQAFERALMDGIRADKQCKELADSDRDLQRLIEVTEEWAMAKAELTKAKRAKKAANAHCVLSDVSAQQQFERQFKQDMEELRNSVRDVIGKASSLKSQAPCKTRLCEDHEAMLVKCFDNLLNIIQGYLVKYSKDRQDEALDEFGSCLVWALEMMLDSKPKNFNKSFKMQWDPHPLSTLVREIDTEDATFLHGKDAKLIAIERPLELDPTLVMTLLNDIKREMTIDGLEGENLRNIFLQLICHLRNKGDKSLTKTKQTFRPATKKEYEAQSKRLKAAVGVAPQSWDTAIKSFYAIHVEDTDKLLLDRRTANFVILCPHELCPARVSEATDPVVALCQYFTEIEATKLTYDPRTGHASDRTIKLAGMTYTDSTDLLNKRLANGMLTKEQKKRKGITRTVGCAITMAALYHGVQAIKGVALQNLAEGTAVLCDHVQKSVSNGWYYIWWRVNGVLHIAWFPGPRPSNC